MLMAGSFRGNLLGSARVMPDFAMRDGLYAELANGLGRHGDADDADLFSLKLVPGPDYAADIAGSAATTTSVAIGGSVRSTIDTAGDHDWIRVELVAGQSYEFALNGINAGALSDPLLELRNSSGTLIASDDDGGPGVYSLIAFTASSSGTYYLDAQAYGNETGTYELTASAVATPPPASLLDSIDWGTQVSGSSLTIYFATTGQRFDGATAESNWTAAEKAAVLAAFGVYSDVANLSFAETNSSGSATFVLLKADLGADTLGYCNPPGETNAGVGVFSHTNSTWTDQSLQPGGYAFVTLIHEFGHGLGLAHPHDDGGTSTVMAGVTDSFGSYGNSGLNQGVFTTMSYNDGWVTGPNGVNTSVHNYGWQGTLGPLDIALIQEKYGANTNHNGGASWYQLDDANAAGTMYQAIWDTGGVDGVFYSGSRDVVIDLRAATLLDAAGGGGYVSYVVGIIGGFTIANGVILEKISGGSGNDVLTGNDAANVIAGNDGDDTIHAGGGNDQVYAGNGNDILYGGDGSDPLFGQGGDDYISGGNGWDRLYGGDGNDRMYGGAGRDYIYGDEGDDLLRGGGDNDFFYGGAGNDRMDGNSGTYDRAIYVGNFADYQLSYNSSLHQVSVTDLRAGQPDGWDRLVNIEYLQFADGVVMVNGGSLNFQPSAEPVTLASAPETSETGRFLAALPVDPAMDGDGFGAKSASSPVMDTLDAGHDAFVRLTIDGDGPGALQSGIGRVAEGWAVLDIDHAPGTPVAGDGWLLLSDPSYESGEGAEPVTLSPIAPLGPLVDWVQSGDVDVIVAFDSEPQHEAHDASGWM